MDIALHRANLTVLINAPVVEITSYSSSNAAEFVASGVKFVHNGSTHLVEAAKEVILCAGYVQDM